MEACVLDAAGQVVQRVRCGISRAELETLARTGLRPDDHVALEATTHPWAIVRVLEPFVAEVVVSNPLRTRAIADATGKTDTVDASVLAQLLRADCLPRVWQPDAATQRLRALTTRRAQLVADRTRLTNRLHAGLHQRLLTPPVKALCSRAGLAWLATAPLPPEDRAAVASLQRLLAAVEAELTALDRPLAEAGYADARVRLLLTLPGVDLAVAQTLLAALGDVRRFRDGAHAASSLGLVPSTRQSADHGHHGPITKAGRGHARWRLVQAAQAVADHPGPLGVFFRRLAHRTRSRTVAVVATARTLVVLPGTGSRRGSPIATRCPSRPRRRGGACAPAPAARADRAGPGPTRLAAARARPAVRGSSRRSPRSPRPKGCPPRGRSPRASRPRAGVAPFVASLADSRRVPRRRAPREA